MFRSLSRFRAASGAVRRALERITEQGNDSDASIDSDETLEIRSRWYVVTPRICYLKMVFAPIQQLSFSFHLNLCILLPLVNN